MLQYDWRSWSPSNLEEFMANLTISLRQTVIGSPGSEKLSSPDMFAIGEMLAKEEGLNATHPVILIPGIISTVIFSSSPPQNHSERG